MYHYIKPAIALRESKYAQSNNINCAHCETVTMFWYLTTFYDLKANDSNISLPIQALRHSLETYGLQPVRV